MFGKKDKKDIARWALKTAAVADDGTFLAEYDAIPLYVDIGRGLFKRTDEASRAGESEWRETKTIYYAVRG